MQLVLWRSLENGKGSSLRGAAIVKTLKEENAHTAIIELYLREKYNIEGNLDEKILGKAQADSLYSEI